MHDPYLEYRSTVLPRAVRALAYDLVAFSTNLSMQDAFIRAGLQLGSLLVEVDFPNARGTEEAVRAFALMYADIGRPRAPVNTAAVEHLKAVQAFSKGLLVEVLAMLPRECSTPP